MLSCRPHSAGCGAKLGSGLGYSKDVMHLVKTAALLGFMGALVWLVGYLFMGSYGFWFGMGMAGLMVFGSYFFSSKLALAVHHAKPYDEHTMPEYAGIYQTLALVAKKADIPVPKLYVVDSDTPNAFATGRNPKNSAVAVTTNLVKLLDPDELEGVIAHEISHIGNRDILITSIAAFLAAALSIFARFAFFGFGSSRREHNNPVMLVISIVALFLAPFAAVIIRFAISRTREYQADASGAEITGQPLRLATALQKLNEGPPSELGSNPAFSSLWIADPLRADAEKQNTRPQGGSGGFWKRLFSTHPPVGERVRRLEEMAYGQIWS